jgi:hypothetical protein
MATTKKVETNKKPKTKAVAKKNVAKKVGAKTAPTSSQASSSQNNENLDFGGKLSWIFNNLKTVWDNILLNLGTLVLIWLIPFAIMMLAMIVILAGGAGWLEFLNNSNSVSGGGVAFGGVTILGLFLFFVGLVVAVILAPASTIVQLQSTRGNKIDFKTTWQKSLKFIGRYILIYLVIGLAIIMPILLSILLMTVLIGFLLLPLAFIFAVVVGFFTMLAPYVLIDKDLKASEAIEQGYNLAKIHWQWLLAVILVGMVAGFASYIVSWIPIIGFFVQLLVSVGVLFVTALVYVKKIAIN